jgi:putative membrane protein
MLTVALVFAALAALVHVYIFNIESLAFEKPSTLKAFGITAEEAAVMKPWAYNQGWYNLFLAIGTFAGIGLNIGDNRDAGVALVIFGTGSMLTAALILISSDKSKARAAVMQGLFPALTLVSLAVWCLTK